MKINLPLWKALRGAYLRGLAGHIVRCVPLFVIESSPFCCVLNFIIEILYVCG